MAFEIHKDTNSEVMILEGANVRNPCQSAGRDAARRMLRPVALRVSCEGVQDKSNHAV